MAPVVVLIPDLFEEMDLIFAQEEGSGDAVHGCVAPALVVEPSRRVKIVEERGVCGSAPEVHVGDFEVTPEVAGSIRLPVVIR